MSTADTYDPAPAAASTAATATARTGAGDGYGEAVRAALAAAGRGWHVFPLVPGAKRPAVRGWQDRATTDPARIERCWTTRTPAGPFGIGIACGPSQLLVVDLDRPKPGHPLPPAWQGLRGVVDGADVLAVLADRADAPDPALSGTYAVTTPTRGRHLYFATSDRLGNTAGCLGPLVDTRGAGGCVVAPPTTLAAGVDGTSNDSNNGTSCGAYEADDPAAPVRPLPPWLTDALRPRQPAPASAAAPAVVRLGTTAAQRRRGDYSGQAERAARYVQAAVDHTLARLLQAAPGTRNRALYLAALTLGRLVAGHALDDAETRAVLTTAADAIGLDAREAIATIGSGLRAGARNPRTIPTTDPTRSTPGAAA